MRCGRRLRSVVLKLHRLNMDIVTPSSICLESTWLYLIAASELARRISFYDTPATRRQQYETWGPEVDTAF